MKTDINEVVINGVTYVNKNNTGAAALATSVDGMKYCIVRCQGAGVFLAYVASRSDDGTQAELKKSRRLWYWSGAASLSQLAMEGTKKPNDCKFPIAVTEQSVTGVLEIIPVSEAAKKSLDSVPVWEQK